jgi:hypothetical protein
MDEPSVRRARDHRPAAHESASELAIRVIRRAQELAKNHADRVRGDRGQGAVHEDVFASRCNAARALVRAMSARRAGGCCSRPGILSDDGRHELSIAGTSPRSPARRSRSASGSSRRPRSARAAAEAPSRRERARCGHRLRHGRRSRAAYHAGGATPSICARSVPDGGADHRGRHRDRSCHRARAGAPRCQSRDR